MGFRRLSILDLSPAGHQPMTFGAGRCTLTFNGEIYNYQALRSGLGGAALASSGDTAVLGTLLSAQPVEQVLRQLRGMFAFAWWDEKERALTAARDPFGIKPLFYRFNESTGELWLGSELRAVRRLSDAEGRPSRRALAQYLRWGAVQAPDTLFEDIQCLPPGHLLRWRDGRLEVQRYFSPQWPGPDQWISDPAAQAAAVRQSLLDSVQAHLVADVPVGVFLSGGLDSTLMAACMKHLGQSDIQAFSIGYTESAGIPDETDAAERTARHLGCRFYRERVSAESLLDRLDQYFDQLDQPTGDALNTWLVSDVASRHVKVAISGLGADEWFAGYNYLRLTALAARSPLARDGLGEVSGRLLQRAQNLLPQALKGHRGWKALFYAAGGAGTTPAEWHAHARTIIGERDLRQLLGLHGDEPDAWTTHTPERAHLIARLRERSTGPWLHQLLLMETETYLSNTLLRDNDATSMAHSLELRVPFVDREVFSLAGRLPPEAKLTTAGGKRILREAMAGLLPEWILRDDQKKTFTLPLMRWMRHPRWRERLHDVLNSTACGNRGWIDPAFTRTIIDRYDRCKVDGKAAWPLSQAVWQLFVLESWALRNA